jgi:hypothetical protein
MLMVSALRRALSCSASAAPRQMARHLDWITSASLAVMSIGALERVSTAAGAGAADEGPASAAPHSETTAAPLIAIRPIMRPSLSSRRWSRTRSSAD